MVGQSSSREHSAVSPKPSPSVSPGLFSHHQPITTAVLSPTVAIVVPGSINPYSPDPAAVSLHSVSTLVSSGFKRLSSLQRNASMFSSAILRKFSECENDLFCSCVLPAIVSCSIFCCIEEVLTSVISTKNTRDITSATPCCFFFIMRLSLLSLCIITKRYCGGKNAINPFFIDFKRSNRKLSI